MSFGGQIVVFVEVGSLTLNPSVDFKLSRSTRGAPCRFRRKRLYLIGDERVENLMVSFVRYFHLCEIVIQSLELEFIDDILRRSFFRVAV